LKNHDHNILCSFFLETQDIGGVPFKKNTSEQFYDSLEIIRDYCSYFLKHQETGIDGGVSFSLFLRKRTPYTPE